MGRVLPVAGRSMFGGVGIYSEGVFFALIADDCVYLKADETSRESFERVGSGPFRPSGERGPTMQYYELPGELLDDPAALRPWLEKALQVARGVTKRVPRR
jgi:DNA transformation protein